MLAESKWRSSVITMAEIPQPVVGVAALALVAIGAYITYRGLENLQKGWTIWQSDPIGAGEVEYEDGAVEVQGTVEQLEAELLTTKYTDTPAVAYDYRLEKHEENRSTESGPEWQTVDSGTEAQPFYVTDETGSVAVDPDGGTVSLDTEKVSGGSEIDVGPVDASTSKRYEGRLAPDDQVHVFGQKRNAQRDGPGDERHYIGDGGETATFTISDTTEGRTVMRFLGRGIGLVVFGLAAIAVGAILSLVFIGQLEFADLPLQWIGLLVQPGL